MSSLYEICSSLANLDFVDEETGVVDTVKLSELNLKFDEKADNIACYYKNLSSEAESIKAEEKRLKDRREAKEAKAEALKKYLQNMLEFIGKKKFESSRCVVNFRSSTAIEVQEKDFIDWALLNGRDDLLKYRTPEASKMAIKTALEVEDIPFVDIVEKQNIQIK